MDSRQYSIQLTKRDLSNNLHPSMSITDCKHFVLKEFGDDCGRVVFVFNEKNLEENVTLQETKIKSGNTMQIYDEPCEMLFPSAGGSSSKLPAIRGSSSRSDYVLVARDRHCDQSSSGSLHEMQNLRHQMKAYIKEFHDLTVNPFVQACLTNPNLMSEVVATAPEVLRMLQSSHSSRSNPPEKFMQLQPHYSAKDNYRQGRRQRSRPASPNSFDGLDMKDILQNLNKNPKIIRDFFKCEDVQRTLRNFQQNPKKVLKIAYYNEVREWEPELELLRRNGFRRLRRNIKALNRTNGNVREAIRFLK